MSSDDSAAILAPGSAVSPPTSRRTLIAGLAAGAAAVGFRGNSVQANSYGAVDLENSASRLETLVRATGDTSGAETVLWSNGSVFAWIPGQGGHHLFDLDFVSIRRWERLENGWRRLSKETGLYLDRETGKVLDAWHNPFIERKVEVMHIFNAPFVRDHVATDEGGTWAVEYWEYENSVLLYRSVLVSRAPDLSPTDYPLHAQADTYDFGEFYSNLVERRDVDDILRTSIPVVTANTRVGQWLPWMEMGQRQGWQINQLRGKKLDRIEDLPRGTLDYLERNAPEMLAAPQDAGEENVNSWKRFKEKLERERTAEAPR